LNFIFVSAETREKKSAVFKINKTSARKLCRVCFQKMLAKEFVQKKNILLKFFNLYILNLFFAEEKSTQKTCKKNCRGLSKSFTLA
jgi:hypothetical protein